MTAQNAVEHSKQGQEYAAEATEEIDAIKTKADDTTKQVETLNHKIEQIGEINDLIIDIAEQTNLLALNASLRRLIKQQATSKPRSTRSKQRRLRPSME